MTGYQKFDKNTFKEQQTQKLSNKNYKKCTFKYNKVS